MINITLRELVDSSEIMKKLAQKSLKGKTAYYIARLLREIDKELTLFNETRGNLIKKYGEKDENGELKIDENGNCKFLPEEMDKFYSEMNDILNDIIELNVNKIELNDLENLDFTPTEMILLEPFIEE